MKPDNFYLREIKKELLPFCLDMAETKEHILLLGKNRKYKRLSRLDYKTIYNSPKMLTSIKSFLIS